MFLRNPLGQVWKNDLDGFEGGVPFDSWMSLFEGGGSSDESWLFKIVGISISLGCGRMMIDSVSLSGFCWIDMDWAEDTLECSFALIPGM